MKSLLRVLLLGLLALILVFTLAFGALLWLTTPPRHQTVALPGLSAPVQVRFDTHGIPYIRAASFRDAAEALGYLHARDRLFQMDLMRRAAGGSLAQWFGPAALDNDEEMRRLGMRRSAAADVADLTPDARAELQAYADGVNAWIAARGRLAAPEFVFFGRPAPWTITDSLLWGKMMGLWLSGNWRLELERQALLGSMPRAKILSLWPDNAEILPEDALAGRPLAAAALGVLSWARHFPQPFTLPAQASNEFAVAGSRTVSGSPLLEGDPHLGFGFPCLWYLARIDTPAGDLAGATAPGVPFMIIGHNSRTAWTFTTTGAAAQDVFIEHPTADGQEYLTPDGPRPFARVTERIAVAGGKDVVLTVLLTRHGPVIGRTRDGRELLAVEMANLAPHDTDGNGLLALNEARSVADVGAAAALITDPVQNLAAADTAGNIAFFTTGRVPIRKAGNGQWPVDGASGAYDWTGFATAPALPHSVNPASGMLVNSNNPTVGPDFPVFISADTYPLWRARRITTLLNQGKQSPGSFSAIQLDVTSDYARRLLPHLLALHVPANDPAAPAFKLLQGWQGEMAMDAPQPLIFEAWMQAFEAEILARNHVDWDRAPVLDDLFTASLAAPAANSDAANLWCNGDCGPVLLDALRNAVAQITTHYGTDPSSWRWGAAHRATFAHPVLSRLPLIGGIGKFSISVPGDSSTVNVSGPVWSAAQSVDFPAIHGPELRAVFDLGALDKSLFIITPGEAGNPLSPYAADLLTRWRDGGHVMLGAMPGSISGTIRMIP